MFFVCSFLQRGVIWNGDTRHQKRIEYLEGELKRIRERRRKEPKDKKESTREIPEDEKA